MELKPEQERMIQEQLANGQFKSVDEVLTAALEAGCLTSAARTAPLLSA